MEINENTKLHENGENQNLSQEEIDEILKDDKLLDGEEKRQIKGNIIKFIIGIILLLMSWSYIQKHPAEKVSVFSGFEVLFQKVEVFFQNIIGDKGEMLERKYGMEKYYKELIKMAENNKCVDINQIKELQDTYHSLRKEKKENLEYILPDYTKKAYEFDNIVKENDC